VIRTAYDPAFTMPVASDDDFLAELRAVSRYLVRR
jgi:hypothetical protein